MGNKNDKKVPFRGINAADLTEGAAGATEVILTIPSGKTAFITRVMATNMGAAVDNLQLFDAAATASPGLASTTLIPDVRVPHQTTVIVDIGEEGIPVYNGITAQATAGGANILAYDMIVIGYYL